MGDLNLDFPHILICRLIIMVPQILGLDICADIMVGDAMKRGISGGQKKRLTTGSKETFISPLHLLLVYSHASYFF